MSLNKAFKKNEVKSATKNKSDFNYDGNHAFFRFYKGYDEFKKMSLDSKYNRMKEFSKFFLNFKSVKKKNQKHSLKKRESWRGFDEVYKNYCNAYKSDFDTDGELTEDKKKRFNYKQFQLDNIISIKSDKLKLPRWVKASKKRFNEILSIITEGKNNGLKADLDGEEITLAKAESWLKGISSKKINRHEFREKYNDIVDNVEKILTKQPLKINEQNMIKILSLLKEIINPNDKKTDQQPDTTNMPELESERSTEQRRNQQGKGLKILTPSQILSRLPISLAQLKAGNNSEKLKNEIKQLLYSLVPTKKAYKRNL